MDATITMYRVTRAVTLVMTMVLATAFVDPAYSGEIVAVSYPPLMIEDAQQPGFAIEIIEEAERRIGVNSRVNFLPFARAIKTVKRSTEIIHPALYRNSERELDYTWIARIHVVSNAFLTVGPAVNSLEEARRLKTIGVEDKTAMEIFLTSQGFTNLEVAASASENARKLAAGRIDAWFLTDILGLWTWKQFGMSDPLTVGISISSSDVYIVGGKQFSASLAERYRSAIESMYADGTILAIIERYR